MNLVETEREWLFKKMLLANKEAQKTKDDEDDAGFVSSGVDNGTSMVVCMHIIVHDIDIKFTPTLQILSSDNEQGIVDEKDEDGQAPLAIPVKKSDARRNKQAVSQAAESPINTQDIVDFSEMCKNDSDPEWV